MKKLTRGKRSTNRIRFQTSRPVDCGQGCSASSSGNKEVKEAALILR